MRRAVNLNFSKVRESILKIAEMVPHKKWGCRHIKQAVVYSVFIASTIAFFEVSVSARDVNVSNISQLQSAVNNSQSGDVILMADGTYSLSSGGLYLSHANVTLRSLSGNRDAVIMDAGMNSGVYEALGISASSITLQDFSIRHSAYHAVHATGGPSASITAVILRNMHIYDCGEQFLKVNGSNGTGGRYFADQGLVEKCLFEFLDKSVMDSVNFPGGFYTGGIDIHQGRGWIIRDNVFKEFNRENKPLEGAIHIWSKSRDSLIERNLMINVYRGITLGMNQTANSGFSERIYGDGVGDSPNYRDHISGIVRNNVIANDAGVDLDGGILSWNGLNDKILHNTIFTQDAPFSSIELRWTNGALLFSNLLSHNIREREGCVGTIKTTNRENIFSQQSSYFLNAFTHDLHLKNTAPAVNQGASTATVTDDMDGELRDTQPDLGADELSPTRKIPSRPRQLRVQ